ncbi:MAG: 3-oxoacyl-[acyl-carrier-protein] synthase III C-terminal domain-containing protein [Ardenticatenales bacterium]
MTDVTRSYPPPPSLPVRIAGLGAHLPPRVVSSAEVEARCGLPAGWAERFNGVRERRWAAPGDTNSAYAAEAVRAAVADAGLALDDIDLLVFASGTPEQAIPDGGPLTLRALGLGGSGVAAFSVHATCLSFLAALDVVAGLIAVGRYRVAVIVSAEIASIGINFDEPESATLLGDGAAAAVVVPWGASTPGGASVGATSRIEAARFEAYGDGAALTEVRGGGTRRHPTNPATEPADNLFHMNGPELLRLVRRHGPDFLERLRPGLSRGLGSIDVVIPHQASLAGLRLLGRFGWPDERIVTTLERYGNCVAASLPLTLWEAVRTGRLARGQRALLVGTGAGVSLGGMVIVY